MHVLPWERLLWRGRSFWPPFERYSLTDFRIMSTGRAQSTEIVIDDIGDIHRTRSVADRPTGTSSVIVRTRTGRTTITLRHIRRGAQVAALFELLAGDPQTAVDFDSVQAALSWNPTPHPYRIRHALIAIVTVVVGLFGAVFGLQGEASLVDYPAGDAIYPGGQKRDRDEIVRFMENTVMPWARATLGPLKGGPDRVNCETCHGTESEDVSWRMPGVTALPEPQVRARGWERYSGGMDTQMRNAIYGYTAESDKQSRAGYMREVVMPGMARLLGRPAYDFARTYEYNRTRVAFGCYHCHKVDSPRRWSDE